MPGYAHVIFEQREFRKIQVCIEMIANLNTLPIDQRIQLVEDLWDSIAQERAVLAITQDQKVELDLRLNAYALDGNQGRDAKLVLADIRKQL